MIYLLISCAALIAACLCLLKIYMEAREGMAHDKDEIEELHSEVIQTAKYTEIAARPASDADAILDRMRSTGTSNLHSLPDMAGTKNDCS